VAVYRRPARQRFVLLIVTLLAVTVVTLDQRGQASGVVDRVRDGAADVLAPVQSAVSSVLSPVGDFFGGIARYDDVKAENARLRRQLEEQKGLVDRAADLEREHKELLDLDGLTFVGDIPSVTARVVSTSPSNFEFSVVIDKGTSDGVAKGMPVVAGEGLVGRVSEVSRERATILLLTDTDSRVGVKVSATGDVGVARGRGSRQPLAVDLVDPGTKATKGEVAVTSGLQGSVFPPGVPVGRVELARTTPGALQATVRITPVVDLRRLTFVRVLQWNP
jgi:rod shape-determining protein MreC